MVSVFSVDNNTSVSHFTSSKFNHLVKVVYSLVCSERSELTVCGRARDKHLARDSTGRWGAASGGKNLPIFVLYVLVILDPWCPTDFMQNG